MSKSLPNIIYSTDKLVPIVDSNNALYTLSFTKGIEYFSNSDAASKFINGVEKEVRTCDRYKKYIDFLKKEVKLNRCQVLSELTDDDVPIEMHHGPIFNLYDYCSIMIEYFLYKKWKITSFRIADMVMKEHEANRVQVVMLSSTIHEAVHNRDIFINYKQGFGDIKGFIDKYSIVFLPEHIEKLNRYIDRSLMMDSTDNDVLKLSPKIGG